MNTFRTLFLSFFVSCHCIVYAQTQTHNWTGITNSDSNKTANWFKYARTDPGVYKFGFDTNATVAPGTVTIKAARQFNATAPWTCFTESAFTLNDICQYRAGVGTTSIVKEGYGTAAVTIIANTQTGVTVLEGCIGLDHQINMIQGGINELAYRHNLSGKRTASVYHVGGNRILQLNGDPQRT